ncbi:MAG: quinone-dependent dihydroorotate dehydrogenase [Flavobacteriaceae bacterium]|nr:quinone-dependent dihydroorotate dehydrogenase [Flavobacteriaceae bacterium]
MYKSIIRPLLFKFDPEAVHHFSFLSLKFVFKFPFTTSFFRKKFKADDESLTQEVFGLKFKNPVGLAAGFDKDAKLYKELDHLGFGFIEIGTVTPVGQPGNPKKRLFRLKKDQAIINRMGFNNEGVKATAERLKSNPGILIGGNIGKNKNTPNKDAVRDYEICFHELHPFVDYFVVNVSSPNTPNLRELQDKEPLTKLLLQLKQLNNEKEIQRPILLKIAPDLTDEQLLDIIEIVETTGIDGLIATNTTISRAGLVSEDKNEVGGLSGKPLTRRSTEVIKFIKSNSKSKFPIIGVGGIHSPEDAIEKLEAGASLIQLYTGFVYEGPSLIQEINQAIKNKLK